MVDPRVLAHAASLIREGRLVAFPTETVYGLGANALDPVAVARIFALKERPTFDPLIVHVCDPAEVPRLAWADDPRVHRLMEAFWPGPLTLVLRRREVIPDLVCAGLPTVGVRMPAHPVALGLIRESGCPIAAPSANKFGRVSPTRAEHVRRLLPGVDLVIDGGQTPVGLESTIVSLDELGFIILRPGVITRDALERHVPASPHRPPPGSASAPGMLKSHYSPSKPLYLRGTEPPSLPRARGGYLCAAGDAPRDYGHVVELSPRGDLLEAAAGLFAALHELEEADVDYLVADPVEDVGVGAAIMDRLRKAAWRFRTPGGNASPAS